MDGQTAPPAHPPTMQCERRELTLTHRGCGRLWEAAQAKHAAKKLQPWEGIVTCRTCPVGARNAGRQAEAVFVPAAILAAYCPRCSRPASRLINERLCVSCYNRDREALVGRDAKGNRPALCDRVHDARFVVIGDGRDREVSVCRVLDAAEAMRRVARDAKAPILFGWSRAA